MRHLSSMAVAAKRLAIIVALMVVVAACAPTRVESAFSPPPVPLPRPQIVVVEDFAEPSGGAVLDQGLGARLGRAVSGSTGSGEREAEAAKTADALARALVQHLSDAGVPAMRSAVAPAPAGGPVMIVTGELLRVDEGNRTRRNLIGFGAGHSEVVADVQVYLAQPGGAPVLVQFFTADAQSGRKPGAVTTAGVGEATGRLAETAAVGVGTSSAAELLSASPEADAKRVGKEIARKITAMFSTPSN